MSAKFKNGIDVNSQKITSVADPATTTDAATKNYVDTQNALNAKLASANTFTAGPQTIAPTSDVKGIVVKNGVSSSPTANLQEWQDFSGGVLVRVDANGAVGTSNSFGSTTSGLTYLKPNYDTSGMGIVVQNATHKGIVIKAAASQSANLQEWQNTYTTTVTATGTTTVSGTGFLPAMYGGTLTVGGTSYTITGYTSSTSITINTAATFNASGTIVYASASLNNNGVLWINGGSSTAADTVTDVATLIPSDKFHQFSSSTTIGGSQRRLIGYVSNTSNIDIGQTLTGIIRGINLKPGNGNQTSYVTGALGYHAFFPPNYFSGAGTSTTENGYLASTDILTGGTWTSTGWTAATGITITNVSNTLGSAVTYTTGATAHGLVKDQTAIITGFTNNTGFNTTGAQIIAVPSTTTFTIPNSTTTGTQPSPYGSVTGNTYTRSSGAAALSNSAAVSTSNYYQVTYSITGTNTTDQVTINLGGLSTTITTSNGTTSGIWGPKPTATTGLSVDTSTNWTGTITISIRQINASTPVYQILDSTGNSAFEIRTSPTALTGGTGNPRNLFIGRNAGSRAVYNGTTSVATASAVSTTAIGDAALANATTGANNTAVGANAATSLTTGNANVAIGTSALNSMTSAGGNTAVGYSALGATTTGGTNTAIGQQAGQSNTTGSANMFIGYFSGNGVTTGSQNVFVGREAGSTTVGQVNPVSNSIAIGYSAFTTASNQAAIGNTSITETRLQAPTVYGTNISLNALVAPTISSTSTAATGGTLAQNTTYYYVMTSINAAGVETVQGTEQSRLTGNTTATNTITLNWSIVPGATSYRIYRSTTSGSYASASYYAIAAAYTITYIDTNATATGTATPPSAPTGTALTVNSWSGQTGNALAVNGAVAMPYRAITAARTLDGTDYTVDCTSAGFTVTLPTAVGATGRTYVIKNTAATGTVTIATTSSQTIDGVTTKTLTTQYSSLVVQSTGANWIVIN